MVRQYGGKPGLRQRPAAVPEIPTMSAALYITSDDSAEMSCRFSNVLQQAELDCHCRETLSGALERFTTLERQRVSRNGIAAARRHKERIAAVLQFLAELDELTDSETDRSVFEELALAFLDIAAAATAGAAALREVDSH
jgi:hypothetical protein